MGMIQEFKEFAMNGNVMDMAVGIIIGGAFGEIVKSLVNDVLMPPIGMALGRVDFKALDREPRRPLGPGGDRRSALRAVPQLGDQFPDRGGVHFHGHQGDQPPESAKSRRRRSPSSQRARKNYWRKYGDALVARR